MFVLRQLRALLVPSLSDFLFLALLWWGFAAGNGWQALLADGDTGWHIRTGEYILETKSVPQRDLFSFSRAGEPWFAWEWLADVVFALLHRAGGLRALVSFTGLILCTGVTLLFRQMLWRGANVLLALAAVLLANGAATLHYLARPHIFTLLGFAAGLWWLERDRQSPGQWVWWLVPATALWANLHGGFLAWLACLALAAGGELLSAVRISGRGHHLKMARRYALLTAGCAAASLINPYGYRLHLHMLSYLRSDWIRQVVEEFQAPRFRSESLLDFEILLFAGLLLVPRLAGAGRWKDALLVVFWGHAALVSARHVPLYAWIAAPVCAQEGSAWWREWSAAAAPRSVAGILRDCLRDFSRARPRTSLWLPGLAGVILLLGRSWPSDFPRATFPVAAVERTLRWLTPAEADSPRVFTTDQWGDYLIYRFYPRQRVFVDGRSDFYGRDVGGEYLRLMNPAYDWEAILARYRFEVALLPVEWPLAALLKSSPDWRVRYDDGQAILFEHGGSPALNPSPLSAE